MAACFHLSWGVSKVMELPSLDVPICTNSEGLGIAHMGDGKRNLRQPHTVCANIWSRARTQNLQEERSDQTAGSTGVREMPLQCPNVSLGSLSSASARTTARMRDAHPGGDALGPVRKYVKSSQMPPVF